ncbi:hypothetical protein G4B88_022620 [Cannabis sativa]|uniref:ER membrane protein complex subunit 3 n=1 Tax=Cannabis sativa TaxID=3483 RepID=A0A7J6HW40_CANSA|nr:hypothetical protein G4B88_022620 [Cannabis sativa]
MLSSCWCQKKRWARGLNKVCGVSPELQAVVGEPKMPRTEVIDRKLVFRQYCETALGIHKKNNLQDPSNKRKIICDDALRVVFETDCTDMFKMNKLLAKHIIALEPTKASSQSKRAKVEVEPKAESTDSGSACVIISEALAKFLDTGGREMLRTDALNRVWEYIKTNQLEGQGIFAIWSLLMVEKIRKEISFSLLQVVVRARNLRAGANFIPAKSFRARRFYFSNEENGLLHVPKGQGQNPQAQMFSDPNMAMDMMKKNLSMIIPQTLTFAWVNFFFSGFVAAKIPFPLTQRFRSMLQNGIDLSTVDVSYVSSRSWYFLNLFGLRGLFSLILGEENAMDDTQRMMQMGGFGFDPSKNLGAEKDNLDIMQHDWAMPKFEQRAEAVLRKLVH